MYYKSKADEKAHVVVGADEGMVRAQALELWREWTKGGDEGFQHEIVEGNAVKVDDVQMILGQLTQAMIRQRDRQFGLQRGA